MVSDNGNGGGLDYGIVDPQLRPLLNEAEQWCRQLPPIISSLSGEEPRSLEMDLELYIGDLLEKHLEGKEQERMEKKMVTAFVIGATDSIEYTSFDFKTVTLQQILDHPEGHKKMEEMIRTKLLPKLTDGMVLLNTNIPEDILLSAGLKEGQYVKPQNQTTVSQNKQRSPGRRP